MNNKFIVVNDKAIVFDEYNKTKILDYSSNILKVLKQENKIELIKSQKEDIEQEINNLNRICSCSKIWCFWPIFTEAIALGVGSIFLNTLGNNEIRNTIFGEMSAENLSVLAAGTLFTPFITWVSLGELSIMKNNEKRLNALKATQVYIDDKIAEEKEELEKIDNGETKNSTYIDGTEVIVEDDGFLNDFNKQIDFYYNVGFQARKYNKYLQKGKLEEKLHRHYSDDEIKEVKEIIKKLDL